MSDAIPGTSNAWPQDPDRLKGEDHAFQGEVALRSREYKRMRDQYRMAGDAYLSFLEKLEKPLPEIPNARTLICALYWRSTVVCFARAHHFHLALALESRSLSACLGHPDLITSLLDTLDECRLRLNGRKVQVGDIWEEYRGGEEDDDKLTWRVTAIVGEVVEMENPTSMILRPMNRTEDKQVMTHDYRVWHLQKRDSAEAQ